ncbi:MAG: molybdenum cofactor biosynthesis protein MoaE [Calditerrivibrio sp.]|nr:molybdenum cofactor biosynthesis protein MoaE [Calditerrivibrio sp.]MCA1932254.1 molybdenum cofactor biosynthesis protein MoaE [Calditerrivibrio sp.]MCA1980512.1 molybdenum cofactor biosynthesis protein MoaE [Calditerrivibrio sp.]
MDNILVEIKNNPDIQLLYKQFYSSLSDSTGTILIHHGKAKYPGKYVKDYNKINLYIKDERAFEIIKREAEKIYAKYSLNKIFVVHNIGIIDRNDTILFLAVESKDRDSGFESIREMLEFIKAETLIGLEEMQ